MINNKYPNISPSLNLDFTNSNTIDPRITFSRASAATYYDGKTVAKAEENLLVRSQEFDHPSWAKGEATVSPNTDVAPDGTSTADTLSAASSTSSAGARVLQPCSQLPTGTYTFSVWIKRKVGAGTASLGLTTADTPANSTPLSISSDWQRFSVTGNIVTSSSFSPRILLGAANDAVAIWGAQLEQRSQVTAYTPTTTQPITNYIPVLQTAPANVPRIDHDPVTGECKGLLVEEQRTNLLTYSEQFDNDAWTQANVTVSPNAVIAPDGTKTGDKLIEDSSALSHVVNRTAAFVPTSGTVYTTAVYAKAGERTIVRLQWTDSMAVACTVNLTDGSVSDGSAAVTHVGNGWWRIALTTTASGVTPSSLYIAPRVTTGGGTSAYQGDGYSGIYIWGAQLEVRAFPTSYIKTEASQVTRAADYAAMTGANFSSWYRQDEGTLFAEATAGQFTGVTAVLLSLNKAATPNTDYFLMRRLTDNTFSMESVANNAVAVASSVNGGLWSPRSKAKLACGLKTKDYALVAKGALIASSSLSPFLVPDSLRLGATFGGSAYWNGHISRLAYYPGRQPDAQLQALTA